MFLFSFQCIGVRDFADCLDLGCLLFSAFRSLVGRADDRFSLGKWCQMQCGRPRLLSCNSLWTKIYRSKSSDWWTKLRLENFVSSENSNCPTKLHLEILLPWGFLSYRRDDRLSICCRRHSNLVFFACGCIFPIQSLLVIYEGGEHTLNDQFSLVYLCCGCGKHRSSSRFPC